MPARKPTSLIERHETAAETSQRAAHDAKMLPQRALSMDAPAQLADHKVAQTVWRRLMRVYSELEGVIVTRLDQDMLIDYCMISEQVSELDELRRSAIVVWRAVQDKFTALPETATADEKYNLALKVQETLADVVKVDGRVDRKRDLLFKLRQSLYLTPRARAGTAPARKEKEPEKDALESLLDDVTEFVNGAQ
jgi:phage terminase small subunit